MTLIYNFRASVVAFETHVQDKATPVAHWHQSLIVQVWGFHPWVPRGTVGVLPLGQTLAVSQSSLYSVESKQSLK